MQPRDTKREARDEFEMRHAKLEGETSTRNETQSAKRDTNVAPDVSPGSGLINWAEPLQGRQAVRRRRQNKSPAARPGFSINSKFQDSKSHTPNGAFPRLSIPYGMQRLRLTVAFRHIDIQILD